MANGREEVEVGMALDGASLGKMFADLDKRLNHIKTQVDQIGKAAFQAGSKFDQGLLASINKLNKVEGIVNKFERNQKATARSPVTTVTDNQQFGTSVRRATEYSKSLRDASTHAEMLDVRINRLIQTAAKQGEMTQHQRRRINQLEEERGIVTRLERQYGSLNDRMRQSQIDGRAYFSRVQQARTSLSTALTQTGRTNFGRELNELKDAQVALDNYIKSVNRLRGQEPPGAPKLFGATGLKGVFARTAAYGGAASLMFGGLQLTTQSLAFVRDYEAELKQLQAIAGATNTQMREMAGAIESVGRNTKFSLMDLTKMAQILAQAGISSGKMPGVLDAVSKLAVSSGSTPDDAVQLVTSALGAFQLQGSEATRVADLMTEALNRTKLTVQQTALAIQYVGATAFEQNISLEQMLATVAAVAQAGVKSGSTIGTGFRQFLVDVESPSKKMLEVLEKYNLTAKDVDIQTRGLRDVIETMAHSGIGAADAYQAMETRAAAWYLIVKNNLDLIDQLQISFTNQEASVRANAIAMDSMSAQWQRLKNVMSEKFFEKMQGPLTVLKNLFKELGEAIDNARERAERFDEHASKKDTIFQKIMHTDVSPGLERALELGLNWASPKSGSMMNSGLGTWLRKLGEDTSDLTGKQEQLATQLAKTSEKVEEKRAKVDGLSKELERLYTQQESIEKSDSRLQAETATLSNRFEGLAKYLVDTKMKFDDLALAMEKLRKEEQGLLAGGYLDQVYSFKEQRKDNAANFTELRRRILSIGDDFLLKQGVDPKTLAALRSPGKSGQEQVTSAALLTDAALKLQNTPGMESIAENLRQAANMLRSFVTNGVNAQLSHRGALIAAGAGTSGGMQYEQRISDVTGDLQRMNAMTEEERKKLGGILLKSVDQALGSVAGRKGGANPNQMVYLNDVQSRLEDLRRAIIGVTKATKDEKDAKDKAAKEEAANSRKVKREDIDAIGKQFGLKLGSGFRSQEEQDRLRRQGYTKAVRSQHTYSLARDFPTPGMSFADMKRLAARMQMQADATLGKGAIRFIAEDPASNGMGTGKHIHGQASKDHQVAKNTQLQEDPLSELRSAMKTGQLSAANIDADIKTTIKQLKEGVSEELFFALGDQASADIEAWAIVIRETAKDQAAIENLDDADTALRLKQVDEQIADKFAELSDVLFDAWIKSVTKSIDDAKQKFEGGMSMFNRNADVAAAVINGFSYTSNENRIPDFVQQLAQRRAGVAGENRDRARANLLPSLISDIDGQISRLEAGKTNLTDPVKLEEAGRLIRDLRLEVMGLRSEKEQLDAALSAGGLVPTTFSGGLQQAIQAYREANNLGASFQEHVVMNMSEGLATVHQGLTDFFTNIITGARTAGQAFGDFARSIMNWLAQMVAKFIASKIFGMLLGMLGGTMGNTGDVTQGAIAMFHGGQIPRMVSARNGRHITGGVPGRDSTLVHGAQGEFMLRKAAVDSLGLDFVRDMNERGQHAVKPRGVVLPQGSRNETNVYIVKENEKPQLGPNDVLVVVQDDILRNGQTKKLIKHVAQGG